MNTLLRSLSALALAMLAAHAVEAAPLLSNGSFEIGEGKPAGWGLPAGVTWETEEAGNRFVRLTANGSMIMLYREVDVRGKKALQLDLRVRHVGIKSGEKPWFDGRIMMNFRDAERKEVNGGPGAPNFRGTAEAWKQISTRFRVPEGAVTLAMVPCLFKAAEGTLDLDDIVLTEIDPGLVEAGKPKGVDDPALPQAIAARDPRLRYSGRWDASDPAGPRSEWPATQIHLTLEGTAINAVLAGPHAFQVVVDGTPVKTVTILPGQSIYNLASGLAPGPHRVELCKRTEGWGGPVQVKGFQLPAEARLLDPPTFARRMLFIGDSITCGYGNEAKSENEHFSGATENASLAWGAVTARALEAELTSLAVSGIWLQTNTEGKPPMPEMWTRTMPFTASQPWDASRWQPDVVVVNLGTNDKRKPVDPEAWKTAYRAFIAQVRGAHPQAHIFLCIGPMGQGNIAESNTALVAEYAAHGDDKMHALAFPDQKKANGIGADWHPSVKTHQLMADQITAVIRAQLGW